MNTSTKENSSLTTGLFVSAILILGANLYTVQHQAANDQGNESSSYQSIAKLRQDLSSLDV